MLLIAVFTITTLTNSCQHNAMEQKLVNAIDEISMEADFKAYLFLSALDNEHQCYLLPELVQIIASNVSKLIDKDCYEKHEGKFLNDASLLLSFIENKCNESMNHTCIANIVKRCLNHKKKSLSEIKGNYGGTVFHRVMYHAYCRPKSNISIPIVEWINVLCLIAGKDAWNIICMKNINNNTSFHTNASVDIIKALLPMAPNHQAAWDLIITPEDATGESILQCAERNSYVELSELLELYCPKEQ